MNVLIVGAGASGMIAAISAKKANKNAEITVLEHNLKPGKKILATGNGRCNLTNKQINTDCFRSHDLDRLNKWISEFGTENVTEFFKELGLLCVDKKGYVYPYSCQAATVNDLLIRTCYELGVNILTDTHVIDIAKKEDIFEVKTSIGYEEDGVRKKKRETFVADRVILACGSRAYSNLGSDGSGYGIAKNLGLKMIPVVPALTGLKCKERVYSLGAGVRTTARIELFVDHEKLAEDLGELQLTEYGLSGIPTFQVSRYASYGLADGCKVHVNIDFMPELTKEMVKAFIVDNGKSYQDRSIYELLCGMLNNKLVKMLVTYCRINEEDKISDIDEETVLKLVDAIKEFYSVVIGTNDFEQAQVCAGGIRLSEVDDDFQSVKVSKLYIIGELLDVDGICGGYNLHWAWLSGITAGRNVVK